MAIRLIRRIHERRQTIRLTNGSAEELLGGSVKLEKKLHHGTGDVELAIRNFDDLAKAKPLILKSFEEN